MKILKDYVAPTLALLVAVVAWTLMMWVFFLYTADTFVGIAAGQSSHEQDYPGDERDRGITNNPHGDSMDDATARKFDIIEYESSLITEGK